MKIKQFSEEQQLLSQYDPADRDLAHWAGPGWYYMTCDYHWSGPFETKEACMQAADTYGRE